MIWLICGIVLWSGLHFIPASARSFRQTLIDKFGEKGYRLGFSLGVVVSIALMVAGWITGTQWQVYQPPEWGRPVAMLFVLAGFVLFGLAKAKTNVKRYLRHPQLTGLVAWGAGHLLANGDNLALVQFGGMGLWAVVQMALINRRDGAWKKPGALPLSAEIKPVVIGIIIFTAFLFAHPYLFGVSPFPQN